MILTEQEAYNLCYKTAVRLIRDFGYDRNLVNMEVVRRCVAIARHESSFNTEAKSKTTSATGLFQVLKATRQETEQKRLKIPIRTQAALLDKDYAALIGMAYFVYQYQRYGTFDQAVMAYNQGSVTAKNRSNGLAYLKTHNGYFYGFDFAALENRLENQTQAALFTTTFRSEWT